MIWDRRQPAGARKTGRLCVLTPIPPAVLHHHCALWYPPTLTRRAHQIVKDREAWCSALHGVAKGWTWLRDWAKGFRLEVGQRPWCFRVCSVHLNFLNHLTMPSPVHPSPRRTLAYTHLWRPRCLNLVKDFGPYLFLQHIKLLSLFLESGKLLSYVVLLPCSLNIFLINSQFYMFQDKRCWNIKHAVFLWNSHSRKCGFKTVTSADLI